MIRTDDMLHQPPLQPLASLHWLSTKNLSPSPNQEHHRCSSYRCGGWYRYALHFSVTEGGVPSIESFIRRATGEASPVKAVTFHDLRHLMLHLSTFKPKHMIINRFDLVIFDGVHRSSLLSDPQEHRRSRTSASSLHPSL